MRRARAAALRPAATPPMTTSAMGRYSSFFICWTKLRISKLFELAVGKETVDGVLLIGEQVEHRGQLGHHQKLDIAAVQVEQLDRARRPCAWWWRT